MPLRLIAVLGLLSIWTLVSGSPGMGTPPGAAGSLVATQPASAQARRIPLTGMQELPGRASVLIQRDGVDLFDQEADTPLAVASAVKLAILVGLQRQIAAGERAWDEVITLQPAWKTLPSGILQAWPDGAPLTIDTLAALMISISDNTAANALIDIVGRDAIEAISPRNRPLLNISEFVALKDPANADLLARFRAGDEATRRYVLAQASRRPTPPISTFSNGPVATDVEYFLTARELCELIEEVAELPLMGINPGAASRNAWTRVAFKGGSEPGVLNLTHAMLDRRGSAWCVVVTSNSAATIDERAVIETVRILLEDLQEHLAP